jgi:hypothetical protein
MLLLLIVNIYIYMKQVAIDGNLFLLIFESVLLRNMLTYIFHIPICATMSDPVILFSD